MSKTKKIDYTATRVDVLPFQLPPVQLQPTADSSWVWVRCSGEIQHPNSAKRIKILHQKKHFKSLLFRVTMNKTKCSQRASVHSVKLRSSDWLEQQVTCIQPCPSSKSDLESPQQHPSHPAAEQLCFSWSHPVSRTPLPQKERSAIVMRSNTAMTVKSLPWSFPNAVLHNSTKVPHV